MATADFKPSTRGQTVLSFSASYISYAHTIFAYLAFFSALFIGIYLHYHKIVKNEVAEWPDEWFPSVSAVIGDWYPERNVFQIGIAISSGPRFALVFCWYLLTRMQNPLSLLPPFVLTVGLIRTLACGGWVYITSSDNHDWHDIFMITYLLCCIPWMWSVLQASSNSAKTSKGGHIRSLKLRKRIAGLFFGSLLPLIYFFIQHKVKHIPGAYTYYAFIEWSLILYDVAFDAVTALDFNRFEIRLVDVGDLHGGSNVAGPVGAYVATTIAEKKATKKGEGTKFPWKAVVNHVTNLYLCVQFWTILTSLGVSVWYFPLWHMGISGYEAFVMTTVSPMLLGIPFLRKALISNAGIGATHLLSVIGILSYRAQQPELRLALVGIGVALTCLAVASQIYAERNDHKALQRRGALLALGLVGSNLLKLACHSNNPFWPIMNKTNGGWNGLGVLLGIISSLDLILRTDTQEKIHQTDRRQKRKLDGEVIGRQGSSLAAAAGFGALLFSLHLLLADSGTIITWVWDGYPMRGPRPIPHGAITLMAMCAGILIMEYRPHFPSSRAAFVMGASACALLYNFHCWIGFAGGLIFTVYLVSMIPLFLRSCSRHEPGRTFFMGFLMYNLYVLAAVWVVAYAFVPGGPFFRERTWMVLLADILCLGLGQWDAQSLPKDDISTPRSKTGAQQRLRPPFIRTTAAVFALLGLGLALHRLPKKAFTPYHPEAKVLTAGIWTVHFGLDNGMWDSNYRMRDLIRDMELDVVGLLETDLQRIIMGNRDMTQFLGEDLGMYTDYGPGPNKHTWGAVLLSKFPILNSTHHLLPSPHGELAPAIHATLDVYGTEVDVIVSHNGQEEDPLDRELQTRALAKIMSDRYPRPFIFLGYVVTQPHKGNYHTLIDGGRMHDVDPSDTDRWCEYIAFRGLKRVGYARVSRSTITDTELQVAKFQLHSPAIDLEVAAQTASYDHLEESAVPKDLRFPPIFKGSGVRGHFYHVFSEPKYYSY